jgi:hypothetical protein
MYFNNSDRILTTQRRPLVATVTVPFLYGLGLYYRVAVSNELTRLCKVEGVGVGVGGGGSKSVDVSLKESNTPEYNSLFIKVGSTNTT